MAKIIEMNCHYCGEAITLTDYIVSKRTGKRVPLDAETLKPHRCLSPDNPFNKRRLKAEAIAQ